MKTNILIGLMTLVWLVLMANIIWKGTEGKWQVTDAEKIGELEVAKYTNQIIVVAISDEEVRLSFYEKEREEENVTSMMRECENGRREQNAEKKGWKLVLETEAVIGRNGLGKTKEGDGKTPVGVFRFTKAFGILENPEAKMKYTQVDEGHYWVDDSNSKYYNQFISIADVVPDWESAEHICEYGESYHYVLATSYNFARIPGVGSAVFLHCTSKNAKVTEGCIAVPENYMKVLMKRVEEKCLVIIDEVEKILDY